jgi:hypothetical protein
MSLKGYVQDAAFRGNERRSRRVLRAVVCITNRVADRGDDHHHLLDLAGRLARWAIWFLGALAFWALISCGPADIAWVALSLSMANQGDTK